MKILRIMDRLNIGGPAVHAALLTRRMPETVLVTGSEEPGEASFLPAAEKMGVHPLLIPELGRELRLLRDLSTFIKVWRITRRQKPAVVHTHKSKAGALGRLAAFICRVPVRVHTFHGHVFHGYFSRPKSAIFVCIERFLGLLTHRIIAVSPRVKEDLVRYKIASPDKIQVIPLGLDLAAFSGKARNQGTLRRELGVGADVPLVGIVARLVPIKRIDFFLKMARRVLAQAPRAKFVIAGDGDIRASLESLARQLGVQESVYFLGFRDKLEDVYADLDVLALTSANEGSPVSLIEGLAAGCAVVATDVGGVRDVVRHEKTGILADSSSEEAMAEAVVRLIQDPEKRGRLGHAGRADVLERFSIDRLVQDLNTLYSDLLSRS